MYCGRERCSTARHFAHCRVCGEALQSADAMDSLSITMPSSLPLPALEMRALSKRAMAWHVPFSHSMSPRMRRTHSF
jgi:hypothetical protein